MITFLKKITVRHLLLAGAAIGIHFLLGVGGLLFFELTGTPWERATARKYLETYLQKRFTQKMVIKEYPFDFDYWITGKYCQGLCSSKGRRMN